MFGQALAQDPTGGAGGAGGMLVQFLPLILIFVVFYFLLIRPQQKRMRQQREMLAAIRRGDRVVTGGGIIGTVAKVGPQDELTVEIAPNIRVKVIRSTVSTVLAKTEPADDEDEGDQAPAEETTTAPEETPAEPTRTAARR